MVVVGEVDEVVRHLRVLAETLVIGELQPIECAAQPADQPRKEVGRHDGLFFQDFGKQGVVLFEFALLFGRQGQWKMVEVHFDNG